MAALFAARGRGSARGKQGLVHWPARLERRMSGRTVASPENKHRRCCYSCWTLAWHSHFGIRGLVILLIINSIRPIFARRPVDSCPPWPLFGHPSRSSNRPLPSHSRASRPASRPTAVARPAFRPPRHSGPGGAPLLCAHSAYRASSVTAKREPSALRTQPAPCRVSPDAAASESGVCQS